MTTITAFVRSVAILATRKGMRKHVIYDLSQLRTIYAILLWLNFVGDDHLCCTCDIVVSRSSLTSKVLERFITRHTAIVLIPEASIYMIPLYRSVVN